mgnify:CR=1 FL=1
MNDYEIQNPLTLAFSLIDGYNKALKESLSLSLGSENDIEKISENLTVDHDILISMNNKYLSAETDIFNFQKKHQGKISEKIITNIYNSFSSKNENSDQSSNEQIYNLYVHQEDVIKQILNEKNILLASGTGSGKTESFLIPILSYCELNKSVKGIKAILIYPMNALAGDQLDRIAKYNKGTEIKYGCYVGSTPKEAKEIANDLRLKYPNQIHSREEIIKTPPDILITNYVMLDWMLTDSSVNKIFLDAANTMKYLVIDEIHTFKGSKAVHLKFLLRRLKYNFHNNLIHIGTSATIKSKDKNIEGAYLFSKDGDKTLHEFVTSLFDIEENEYELIEPTLIKQNLEVDDEGFDLTHVNNYLKDEFGWSLSFDKNKIIQALSIITNTKIRNNDLDNRLDYVYELLRKSKFIKKLIIRLTNADSNGGGARFFLKEIVPLLPEVNEGLRENVAKTIFSIILYLNQTNKENPFLDLKIHLFLRNIGGTLKRCIQCDSFHSGKQTFCNDCGSPLFNVYRNDIEKCIGKVSDRKLRSELWLESDDNEDNVYYVLISKTNIDSEGIRIKYILNTKENNYNIEHNKDSEYVLQELVSQGNKTVTSYNEVSKYLIPLSDKRKDYQYIVKIVSRILGSKERDKKLLAFCDNKEKVSQYSMVLKDEFISEFFEEYLKYILTSNNLENLSINKTFQLACNSILKKPIDAPFITNLKLYYNELEKCDEYEQLEKDVFKEFPLWFYRFISEGPKGNSNIKQLLSLKNVQTDSIMEEELLEIMIRERWIYKPTFNFQEDSHFIKFSKYLAWQNYGFHVDPSKRISAENLLHSYSLGEKGKNEKEFVDRHDFTTNHGIVLQKLLNENIVFKVTLSDEGVVHANEVDDKFLYILNPEIVEITFPKSSYNSYTELKKDKLLSASYHSSEKNSTEREKTENDFRENKINAVVSTPTLELGIDIGKLREVLMIGVPPLPSNYAQRAGRAGRGSGSNFALLVTFCDEISNHDMYYFREPKEIVEGVINPPSFDYNNRNIIKKHLSAFLFGEFSKRKEDIEYVLDHLEQRNGIINQQIDYLLKEVNQSIIKKEILEEAIHELKGILSRQINKKALRNYLYSNSIFPDYEFSKDFSIYPILLENKKDIISKSYEVSDSFEGELLADYSLSEADPESARYKFVPDQKVFLAGNLYKFSTDGIYTEELISEIDENELFARTYKAFFVEEEKKHAQKSRFKWKYDQPVYYTSSEPNKNIGGILEIGIEKNSTITFNNNGLFNFGDIEGRPFEDNESNKKFIIKYEIVRNILILKFDSLLLSNMKYVYSFLGALNSALVSLYKLDEMELKIIDGASKIDKNKDEEIENGFSVIIYDKSGAQNINFINIFDNIQQISEYTYKRLKDCKCENGCPLCMKSYTTQSFSHLMDKSIAIHIMGYLAGKNKFDPTSLMKTTEEDISFDTVIEIKTTAEGIRALYNKTETYLPSKAEKVGVGQNGIFFRLLKRIIIDDAINNSRGLLIKSNNKALIDAINDGKVNKKKKEDFNEFIKLQFQLLRYKKVFAEKI